MDLGPHDHTTAASTIAFAHTGHAIDDAPGREIRRRNAFDQLIDGAFRIAQAIQAAFDHFGQIVRRNVGGHAHRDPGAAIDQQIGQPRRQQQRFLFAAVIVGAEVHRFLVDIGQQFMGDFRQADFGVTHGGRIVAVDRTEVALPVNQHVAQGEILRHPHNGVVDRRIPVRVIFTDHIPDDTGRFFVCPVPVIVQLVHGEQDTPMHGLEPVTNVREGSPHDDAHGVVQVAAPHFVFQRNGQGLFGERIHGVSEKPSGLNDWAGRHRQRNPLYI